jgi:hypothetical protein
MGNKIFKRVLAMCLAMVLMIASSLAVMAADTTSPGGGDIVPDPVITNRTTFVITKNNSIDVSYTQQNSVKYRIQYKSYNGTWDHCRTITTTDLQKTIANLMRGGRYDIRICGFNKAGKAGEYCKEANRFLRSCSAYVTAKNSGFNVKVTKVNSETTGYKIYWTRDKSFKKFNVMTVNGSTLNKTLAGKKGMTYYVRVVPISVVGGKTYAGVQNSTHAVTIK